MPPTPGFHFRYTVVDKTVPAATSRIVTPPSTASSNPATTGQGRAARVEPVGRSRRRGRSRGARGPNRRPAAAATRRPARSGRRQPAAPSRRVGRAALTRWASSINQVHTAAGFPTPGRSEVVRRVLSGLRRPRKTPPKRRSPLLLADVRRLLAAMGPSMTVWPAGMAAHRDAALLLMRFDCELARYVGLNVALFGRLCDLFGRITSSRRCTRTAVRKTAN